MNKEKKSASGQEIKKILEDLYQIDASFEKYEDELRKIISKIIDAKPNVNIDEKFVARVRKELYAVAVGENEISNKKFVINWSYAFAGVAMICLILLAAMNFDFLSKDKKISNKQSKKIALKEDVIKSLDANAFGSLIISNNAQANGASVTRTDNGSSAVLGYGGGGTAEATSDKMISMPAPDFVKYKYVYVGDELEDIEESLPVYRRIKNGQISMSSVGEFRNLNLIDLEKFKNLNIDNLNFSENREFGYSLFFNLKDNEASISSNYLKWPNAFADCQDDICYQEKRLSVNDVLSDSDAIKMADKFLSDYGVSLEGYGTGVVDKSWLIGYQMELKEGREPYISESLTVVYPMMVAGEEVLDEGGLKTGLRVELSNRYKKATGVYGVRSNRFESSNYEVLNDKIKLVEFAERGGLNMEYEYPGASKVVEVQLGTPKLSLISYWRFGKGEGANEELLIPALVFPIKEKPTEGYFYRENVVIPLVKEIIDERLKNSGNNPRIEPMPLLKTPIIDAGTDGVTGETGQINEMPEVLTEDKDLQATQLQIKR